MKRFGENKLQPVIVIAGYAASGKTTLARKLAESISFAFVDIGSVVRQIALNFVKEGKYTDESSRAVALSSEALIRRYIQKLQLSSEIFGEGSVGVRVNQSLLNINDPDLRQFFLDDETLILARELRQPLRSLQREIAQTTPVVFSARNGRAFYDYEAVKVFIDPGTTTRVRRRAIWESQGQTFFDLLRKQRRDILERIVGKEWKNIDMGTAIARDTVESEGFVVVENKGGIEETLRILEITTLKLLQEKGFVYNQGPEGNQKHPRGPEQF